MSFQRVTFKSEVASEFPQPEMVLAATSVPQAPVRLTLYPTSERPVSFYLTRAALLDLYSTIEHILLETSDDR